MNVKTSQIVCKALVIDFGQFIALKILTDLVLEFTVWHKRYDGKSVPLKAQNRLLIRMIRTALYPGYQKRARQY